MVSRNRAGFSERLRPIAAEPFRIFFVAGLALGILGGALWPAYYGGRLAFYPGASHARLMIEGFMASFIIGFLGTAGPRITGSFPFSVAELISLLTLIALGSGFHAAGANRAGDFTFAMLLAFFGVVLARRFAAREDWPPPNFALVALGLVNGFAGALLLAFNEEAAYTAAYRIGATLLEQGFVLLPVLGIAPFLLPRLLDIPRDDEMPEGRAVPAGWRSRALFALAIGLAIDATLVVEALGATREAAAVRLAVVLVYLALRFPRRGRSFLGNWLRVAIATILIAIAAEAIAPQLRVAALHIMFITGFALIVLTVAIRVIFGHSGSSHLFRRRLPFFIGVASLMFLAMLSRYIADMLPKARAVHLIAAAWCWVVAAALWGVKVLPKVSVPDAD